MSLRLLIVDDHAVVRSFMRDIIAANRPAWQIWEAEDGAKAVAKVLELIPDAVILDFAMPVMNGIEAAKQIRRLAPATKIVLFSAHDVPASVWESYVDAFVPKLSTDELAAVIEQLTRPAVRTVREPTCHIFRGAIGTGDEECLEAVGGLENARQRMEEIAAAKPGLYFVLNVHDHIIVACADTRRLALPSSRRKPKIA